MTNKAVIAVNRFGFGAKQDEIAKAKTRAVDWLKASFTPISYKTKQPDSADISRQLVEYRHQKKMMKEGGNASQEKLANYPRDVLKTLVVDSLNQQINSDNAISWRLLDFFSNHFSVSATGQVMAALAATLEREAIAPNLLGSFENMLIAVTKHPAMILYLNNEKSFGPNAKTQKKGHGMNENLAREILELHTVGVAGGYNQVDVIELAKGITGWSIHNPAKDNKTGFAFREYGHEPGTRTLLGKKYPQKGVSQGEQMLRDLAHHPQTIKHLCFKLAHHFISDTPHTALLTSLEKRWTETKGNLKEVMLALIDSPEAWQTKNEKYKTPRDFVISALRALNLSDIQANQLIASLQILGQRPYNAGSPAGFSDSENDWNGGSALMARIDWINKLVSKANVNAETLMSTLFDNQLSERTYNAVMRAESRKQALTLLLLSPEFLRR